MRFWIAAFARSALAGSAHAASAYARCGISAYVIDQDPKGLNVRTAPSATAGVAKVVGNDDAGEVEIVGYRSGWFRVSKIMAAVADETLFRGDGWVHRSLLHLDVAAADTNLYAAPSRRARLVKKLGGDQPGVTLIACSGDWAEIVVDGVRGWLSPDGQCSNPLTTCA